ncbi:hypothetical protein PG990_001155 [Apiospora arundinis]|uniref:RNA polymerase II-binding domain-containing protein n=1 Tax=Apiospora arundinis TaxID=335852 RepID=A0ABR2I1V9_9PEZI
MSYTDDAVLAKLSTLCETQDSIVTVAQWIMFHRRHAERTVQIWLQRLKDSTSHKRLNLIYLANEVCQQSKVRHKEDFLVAFAPVLAEAASTAYKGAPSEVQQRIQRVVAVWRDRGVFEEPIQAAVEARIQELEKARGSGRPALGGSIFGGSASLPSELASLAKPQADVSKLLLSTKTSITTANSEFSKLMEPGANVPSAPVYAARLNGLVKTLANAEGAVGQCVEARKALVGELQKILDSNKASLAAEEEQLNTFKRRKVEVETKKTDVEFAIMQGLSSNEEIAPSNGTHDQQMQEPDRPEIEELTPEPEAAPQQAPAAPIPEWSPDFPPQEPMVQEHQQPPPPPTVASGIEMLSSLASQFKAVPTGPDGSKKRRLDTSDDLPDLGEDGIDADVSEMLRKESTTS